MAPTRSRARSARPSGLALPKDLSHASLRSFLLSLSTTKLKDPVDGVAELSRQQLTDVCTALDAQIQATFSTLIPSEDEEGVQEEPSDDVVQDAVAVLQGAAILAHELFTKSMQSPPEQLLSAASQLHDGALLAHLEPGCGPMQDAVVRLCSAWWERKAEGADALVARTVPYVLFRALEHMDRGKAAHVHRCYAVRDMLELLDFQDQYIKDVKRLLLLAAMHPAFLRQPEGRRFVAGLFRLDPQFTRELGTIVRNQIPSGQRATLEAYGEILFRAWRDTVGPCAVVVEDDVVQGLMQAAILASTPALAAAIRTVLGGLHGQRSVEKRLDPALVRLYDPVLPRAFGAANAEVRRNATNLLIAAFPICDPEAPADENDTRLTQQLGWLLAGLSDPCPAVREAAVGGACSVLDRFWEIIPAATSAKIVQEITGKLAFDSGSRAVRVAVLRALRVLVDNQHAQPVLKKALPALSCLLSDADPAVRGALVDLLVAVAGCRGLHFWAVVPPEELLEAVAADSEPGVARRIAQILVPSYFPNAQEGPARLAALLRAQPASGEAFCRQLVARFLPDDDPRVAAQQSLDYTASVPMEQILQLVSDLTSHLLATAPSLVAAREAEQQAAQAEPPTKRPKAAGAKADGKGGKQAKEAGGAKKRGKKKPAEADSEDQDGDEQTAAGEDEDVVLEDACSETPAAWLSILAGLAAVAVGVGAAAQAGTETSEQEVGAALADNALEELFRAAEEACEPQAMRLVLQMTAALHFAPAARRLRDALFERLRTNALPGLPGTAAGSSTCPAGSGMDEELLLDGLMVLASGSSAPKLVAMLSAALGVREPQPIRKPVPPKGGAAGRKGGEERAALQQALGAAGLSLEGGEEEEHDGVEHIHCEGCGRPEPDDTMLLCDGCEAACHTHCLRPALDQVPETEWFCWSCEAQLHEVLLEAPAAGRCVYLLLLHEAGRALLCPHAAFDSILEAMCKLAFQEADEVGHTIQAASATEATSGAASAATLPPAASGLCDEPWGAMARYCKAAMHKAMHLMVSPPEEAGEQHWDGEEEQEDAGEGPAGHRHPHPHRTPARTPGSARRRSRGQHTPRTGSAAGGAGGGAGGGAVDASAFEQLGLALEHAIYISSELASMAQGVAAPGVRTAVLQYCQGVLRVLHFVHQVDLVAVQPQQVASVCGLCSSLARLACDQAAATAAADGDDDGEEGAAGAQGEAAEQRARWEYARGTFELVLGLARQMTEAVKRAAGGGEADPAAVTPRASPGRGVQEGAEDELPSQQLERRMHAAAAAEGGAGSGDDGEGGAGAGEGGDAPPPPPPPRVALEELMAQLVDMLCAGRTAGGGGGEGEGEEGDGQGEAEAEEGAQQRGASGGGAGALLLQASTRAAVADLVGELLAVTRRASRTGWLAALCRQVGRVFSADARMLSALEACLKGADTSSNAGAAEPGAPAAAEQPAAAAGQEAGDVEEGQENDENAAQPAADQPGTMARQASGAVGVDVPRGGDGAGRAGKQGGKQAPAAQQQQQQPVAPRVLDLLQQKAGAVGVLAAVVVRVSAARQMHGRTMLWLAGLAGRATAQQPADRSQALGAALLLHLAHAAAQDADQRRRAGGGVRVRSPGGRCGGLAAEAAARAAAAELEAVRKAAGVLRAAVTDGRALQVQEPAGGAAGGAGALGGGLQSVLEQLVERVQAAC